MYFNWYSYGFDGSIVFCFRGKELRCPLTVQKIRAANSFLEINKKNCYPELDLKFYCTLTGFHCEFPPKAIKTKSYSNDQKCEELESSKEESEYSEKEESAIPAQVLLAEPKALTSNMPSKISSSTPGEVVTNGENSFKRDGDDPTTPSEMKFISTRI